MSGPAPRLRARGARLAGDPAASERRLFDQFQATAAHRFFAGAVDDGTAALLAGLTPEANDRTITSAEGVLLGRFDLLGYRALQFGDPVDWRLDPVSGRRSPLLHWSQIDPTDTAVVGDAKIVWELNRQQFLVTLGSAYRATGDERYAAAFGQLVRAWRLANPAGHGVNWASSLEAALRLVSWCWGTLLFRKSPQLTPDLLAEIFAGISDHATHVERYLSRHTSPNTHLTGEALGLLYAGVIGWGSKAATRWRLLGQSILDEQIHRQTLADGVHFEQSTAYLRYTVEIYLHYLILAGRNELSVPAAVGESVQRMLDVLLALRRPDGGLPAIGDADGGCLLPLVPRAPDDLRGVFCTAAVLFQRPDYAWAADHVQPEPLWLLGKSAATSFQALAKAPPAQTSRAFEPGGYVVLRSGWQRDAHQLIFDVGPLGCPLTGAHGHADLLSIQVSAFGDPYLVDPGTYAYSADLPLRNHFRGTSAHTTIVVDDQGQAEPLGPFTWRQRPAASLRTFVSTPLFDFADASHDAYARLADPVTHRRRVVYAKPRGYFVIVDDLAGVERHRIELRFQYAAQPLSATTDGWYLATGPRGHGLLVRAFAAQPLEARIERGRTLPTEGWVSPDYGQREPAPILIYGTTAPLPLRLLTLVLPVEDGAGLPPSVELILDQHGAPLGLAFSDWNETLRFGVDGLDFERPSTCRA